MSRNESKPYRVIGAYDSETTNILDNGKGKTAFPILHQLGITNTSILDITPDNVESVVKVYMYRHCVDLYAHLDAIAEQELEYVPVIACHNLSFDMYGLSSWLARHEVRVLAKSARKPISFTILRDNQPALVIWDTLIFTQKSLDYMGRECGYRKLSGAWDYDKVRTPATPLTADELDYAKHDVYALFAYLGYWCRVNPDIEPASLGKKVVTKTGVVRARRMNRFSKVKGKGLAKSVGKYWIMQNISNMPKTDDELFTTQACTRGGFTFVSSVNASRVFDLQGGLHVYAYDATSQHPAQIVSHRYPDKFRPATCEELNVAADIITSKSVSDILNNYAKPFPVAINACYRFVNLRPKKGSLFAKWGVYPLASARCKDYAPDAFFDDNQQQAEFREHIANEGYRDKTVNGSFLFGKLVSADVAELYVTELALWEIAQAYEYDSIQAVHGYITTRFSRPSDMAVISVMQFYAGKNAFKKARSEFYEKGTINNDRELLSLGLPQFVIDGMRRGDIAENIVESTYLGLKADLNALFGVEACNEYRRDTVLDSTGIAYEGEFGICNAPKTPKAWYQMGQRIVGWSRIAQILVMSLVSKYALEIVNGDTDSIKIVSRETNLSAIESKLHIYADAVDVAKKDVCSRVRACYPDYHDRLDGIGHYVLEFDARRFCASWNKAYVIADEETCKFTLAGIPASRENEDGMSINKLAAAFMHEHSFEEMCNVFLGYNVTYTYDLIKLHARRFPEWGNVLFSRITDCAGETSNVAETESLCLYPMAKTVNDTGNAENKANEAQALANNPDVNTSRILITSKGVVPVERLIDG